MKVLPGGHFRWLRTLLLVLLMLPFTPLTSNADKAIAADPYAIAGEWEITFDVREGKMRAFWIGRVWDYNGGDERIKAERILPVRCTAFGAPAFGESDVTFDGVDDYITCAVPNYPAIFATMDDAFANGCRCRFSGPPYAAADITPEQSLTYQPVVHHRHLQLEVTQLESKSLRIPWLRKAADVVFHNAPRAEIASAVGLGQAQLTLHYQSGEVESWQSDIFSGWQQNGYQIWMGYDAARYITANSPDDDRRKYLADSGFWDDVLPEYSDGFFMWESDTKPKYTADEMPSGFLLGTSTIITIGHNPDTEEYFKGVIRAVAVDPGCRGH